MANRDRTDTRDRGESRPDPGLESDARTRTAFGSAGPARRAPGDTWGNLHIIEEIGRGGFGCVYRARDDTLARDVALKIIRLPDADPALAASLLEEGRLLARIRHFNVVTVYGARQIDDEIGLWMELVRGRSLADILQHDGPFGPQEAALIGCSLCHALAAVHAAGLLHRDVKANNVMREAGGRIVLMDFGAGRDTRVAAPPWPDMAGTPLYMAPEVLLGQPASPASDLYSLGVLLYFLVSGRFPVEGPTVAAIAAAHGLGCRLLTDIRTDLPDAFVRVVERALDGEPGKRPASAGAMLSGLREAVAAGAPGGPSLQMTAADTPVLSPPMGAYAPAASRAEPRASAGGSAWRWAAGCIAALLAVWILGFLMSVAFDQTMGRAPEFSDDTPFSWLIWGIRSLVAPAMYVLLAILALRLAGSLWQALARLVPSAGRTAAGWYDAVRTRASALPGHTLGQLVVVLQVVSVAFVWLVFRDLIGVFGLFVNTADAASLAPVRPDNSMHGPFRFVLTLLLLVMTIAWYRLWWRGTAGDRPDPVTVTGGVAVIVVVLLMLQLPYRLLYWNEFQRVDFGEARCYAIGERDDSLLLHCPDSAPPRNSVVPRDDPRVVRLGVIESLFTHVPSQ